MLYDKKIEKNVYRRLTIFEGCMLYTYFGPAGIREPRSGRGLSAAQGPWHASN